MNNTVLYLDNLKERLITLLIVPLIFVGFIYISYGQALKGILSLYPDFRLYHLYEQGIFFKTQLISSSKKILPTLTALVGYYSIISIYIFFFVWLILSIITVYFKLSRKIGSKAFILIELIILLCLFVVVIAPGSDIFLIILGYLLIACNFLLLLLYWIHEIKFQ